jgi:hypothetical protein
MTTEQWSALICAVWALYLTITFARIASALDRVASRSGPSMSGIVGALQHIEDRMPRPLYTEDPSGLRVVGTGLPFGAYQPKTAPIPVALVELDEKGEWQPKVKK